MFTVDIKINGKRIRHIKGKNLGSLDDKGEHLEGRSLYEYTYKNIETNESIKGKIVHKREHGIEVLVMIILAELTGLKSMKRNL